MPPFRFALLAALSAALPMVAVSAGSTPDSAISAAVAAPTRTPGNVARDIYRHPAETLAFFQVEPIETVLELIPGGGWYSEILGPLLAEKGTYYGAQPEGRGWETISAKMTESPATYGGLKLVKWPLAEGAIAPDSVDTILTFRNVHNLVMSGSADKAFATFFTLLKPGGTLGIVDHRLPEESDSALEKSSGYVKVSTVRQLAEEAGFVLEAQSEINANPKDTADHPKGVWTLPPILRLEETDRAKYLAIGESDRMTLRFRKPAGK